MDHVLLGAHSPPILFVELVIQILSWLPVKSLVRFRCVCKHWKSIISNPKFIKDHLQKSLGNSDLTLTLGDTGTSTATFVHLCSVRSSLKNPTSTVINEDFSYRLDSRTRYKCVGTCNGLVCLVESYIYHCKKHCVRIWNPATRQISETSFCLLDDLERYPITFPLFGFGYDNLNDTYKVVSVIQLDKEEDAVVKVYSLDDKCWRNIENFPNVGRIIRDNGVYLNGSLNWLVLVDFNSNEDWLSCLVVSLDLGKETYTKLLSPRLPLGGHFPFHPTLGVLMDCLCLFHDYKITHFVVWQMKDFGVQNSWTQLLKVSYQDIQMYDARRYHSLSFLRMHDNGDILITVEHNHQLQAILYNQRDDRVQPVKTFCNIYNLRMARVMDYVESLVSPV